MSPLKRYAKKHAKARQRRRLKAHERLERDQRQAQQAAEALHQALGDLGLPATVVPEIEGRLRSQHKLLGKIVGVMFPPLFGCRTSSELCRVRGWDKNWPTRLLGALPKRSWLKRLRRLGLEVLVPLWRHVAPKSPATQSRWQWSWVYGTRDRWCAGLLAVLCHACVESSPCQELWRSAKGENGYAWSGIPLQQRHILRASSKRSQGTGLGSTPQLTGVGPENCMTMVHVTPRKKYALFFLTSPA
jgi:hypothetical protein